MTTDRRFRKPGKNKLLPGEFPSADALVAGIDWSPAAVNGAGQGSAPPLVQHIEVGPKDLPKSFNLLLTAEQAQLIEAGYKALPYKTRKAMVEDILFEELRRRLTEPLPS